MSATTQCPKCGTKWENTYRLNRHLSRKKKCGVVEDTDDKTIKKNQCQYCGKTFSKRQGLQRHIKHSCIVAKKSSVIIQKVEEQKKTIDELKQKLKQTLSGSSDAIIKNSSVTNANIAQNGSIVNNGTMNITVVNGFDDKRISVPAQILIDIFTKNPILSKLVTDPELAIAYDAETLMPYVKVALIEIIKKSHEDPATQNVYLCEGPDPRTMVYNSAGKWKSQSTNVTIRQLMDSASDRLTGLACNDDERAVVNSVDIESAATKIPYGYRSKKDQILKESSPHITNHLDKMRSAVKKIKIVPAKVTAKKTSEKPAEKKEIISEYARVKRAVHKFLADTSTLELDEVKNWDSFLIESYWKISAMARVNLTEEIEATIDRYLWECGETSKLAKKLSNFYDKSSKKPGKP